MLVVLAHKPGLEPAKSLDTARIGTGVVVLLWRLLPCNRRHGRPPAALRVVTVPIAR